MSTGKDKSAPAKAVQWVEYSRMDAFDRFGAMEKIDGEKRVDDDEEK